VDRSVLVKCMYMGIAYRLSVLSAALLSTKQSSGG
jgi:hypothetical protein